jgi:hypothetical protein
MPGAPMRFRTFMLFRKAIMKRLAAMFVLVLLTMSMANAQKDYGVEVALSSGYVLPAAPMTFANYWNMQYGGCVRIGIPFSESVTLVGAFEYSRFRLNETGVSKGFNTDYMRDIWIFQDVSLKASADPSSVLTASVNVKLAPSGLSGLLAPYFIGGIGMMRFSLSEITLPTTSVLLVNGSRISMTALQTITGGAVTTAFVQFGIGFDIHITDSFDMFVEGRYASGLSKGRGAAIVPLNGGIKFLL